MPQTNMTNESAYRWELDLEHKCAALFARYPVSEASLAAPAALIKRRRRKVRRAAKADHGGAPSQDTAYRKGLVTFTSAPT